MPARQAPRIVALVASLAALLVAGCSQPEPATLEPQTREGRVQLVQFTQITDPTQEQNVERGTSWDAEVQQSEAPKGTLAADYGANEDGEYWQDTIIQAKTYHLEAGAAITTHTHGIVIYAQEIIIDGRINARNLGAPPGEDGYATTRAATMNLYRAYGETDADTGEPRLWGAGSTSKECESPGGGYIILNAPTITLNGELDAGSDCGEAGIVYLEGNVTGTGAIHASLIIHRGAA